MIKSASAVDGPGSYKSSGKMGQSIFAFLEQEENTVLKWETGFVLEADGLPFMYLVI